jgi:uncharacterized protein YjbI with pentapeptide repeats
MIILKCSLMLIGYSLSLYFYFINKKKNVEEIKTDSSFKNLDVEHLRSANLRSANLSSANLHSANLNSADLRSVDLSLIKR